MNDQRTEIVRPAKLADLASITQCAHSAYRKYVKRMGKKPAPMVADFAAQITAKFVHVIERDAGVRGFVVFYPRGDHIHLENIAVHPDYAGHGLGATLVQFVERAARKHKLAAVELYTNAKMTENLPFYSKLGYAVTGRGIEDGFDRIYMRKIIAAQ